MARPMDVIVIGCGAAGIAAIRKLHDAGLKVLGLEAADRIGGRICTVDYGDSTLDTGAAWCHGEKDNIVFELAEPLGLLGRPEPHTNVYVLSNGELADTDQTQEIIGIVEDVVYDADKNNTKSISECVRTALSTNDALRKEPKLSEFIVNVYERMNHVGGQDDPKTGKSLKGLDECWPCEGEFLLNWKGRGYKTILDVLLNKYPDPTKQIPAQILLNKEVKSIIWDAASLGEATDPIVQVECEDSSVYTAKSVIVTMSVGVLKERHESLFDPPLPAEKVTSIDNLQLCTVDKIYIEFGKPWWPQPSFKLIIFWRDEEKNKLSEEDKWITEIFALETVAHQPNVLLAWIYGKGAQAMEQASLDAVKAGVDKMLEVFRKKFDVSPVKNVLRTQWSSNPLTRCSYAYRSVLNEENGGSAIQLSGPLYNKTNFPLVCLAGEATSHHRHTAVHGAVESGFREAERLIKSFEEFGYE
ncbi:hypothetical protein K1T71_009416 [Dendrolimus kikuchii]|uniref:Uncharacterized protein n=1 Tax=Dendrolimus kikuchii TaxID=765133 RepID=A0ACC1CUH8_9NEOP|nr:hypothetical protein K1T71_009416 [Dendrolimus kikuchii]